jgi:SAM-dependent methyltransferase
MTPWRQKLLNAMPSGLRRKIVVPLVHHAGALLVDSGNWILGMQDPLTPPQRLQAGGTGAFKVGYEFLRHFVELGELKPHESVLDIGCGVGRMAAALTTYLRGGSYRGIDIVPQGIHWCQNNITPRYPAFQFAVADIYNKMYNPSGRHRGADYRFPYQDASFDFVFLTSVFTHLLPEDAAHYLKEIGRMLRPGGRLFGTWFLLDEVSRNAMKADRGGLSIAQRYQDRDDVWVQSRDVPEEAIAFDDALVEAFHSAAGLKIKGKPHRGSWSGRDDHLTFQDVVIAVKSG